jgi:hypothetical protein
MKLISSPVVFMKVSGLSVSVKPVESWYPENNLSEIGNYSEVRFYHPERSMGSAVSQQIHARQRSAPVLAEPDQKTENSNRFGRSANSYFKLVGFSLVPRLRWIQPAVHQSPSRMRPDSSILFSSRHTSEQTCSQQATSMWFMSPVAS